MYLHENKEVFKELIIETSERLGINSSIVEKDYYVTIALRLLNSKFDDIVFRGGTSLSKSFGIIERFSEDIDISLDSKNSKITESKRKKLKKAILFTINEIGLEISNLNDIRSRRDFNQYIAKYNSIYTKVDTVKNEIIIETYVATMPFPNTIRKIDNYINKVLEKNERTDIAEKYSLSTFDMKVQGIDRTCIDKVFALCDYFLADKIAKHSRHIYDIYQMRNLIKYSNEFTILVKEVREIRKNISVCLSAQEGVDINILLLEIIKSECYKSDYLERTEKLLFKPISYEIAIEQLREIVNSNCFVK